MPKKSMIALAAILAGTTALPAMAADDVTLRLDWVNGGYHAVWYYAKDKGVFARNGINLTIREGRGSMTTSQTVGNQSDEFGTADGGAMMVLRSKGLKIKMVAGYLRTGPSALIYPKSKGWKSWKDVNNATIADSAGGNTIYLFKAVQKAMGLKGNKDPPGQGQFRSGGPGRWHEFFWLSAKTDHGVERDAGDLSELRGRGRQRARSCHRHA